MKKYIVILLLFQFNFAYSQQINLINENFDGGLPTNWTHCSSNWGNIQQWTANSGAMKEATGPYFGPVSNLILPPFVDLTSVSDPFLEFDIAMAITDSNILLSVWWTIDSTCVFEYDTINNQWMLDSNWNFLSSYGPSNSGATNTISTDSSLNNNWTPLSTDYQTISIDLSQFENQSNIKFVFNSEYLNAWASGVCYIDNVSVFGNSITSISEHSESSSFQLFPNPTKGVVRIVPGNHVDNGTLIITSITGKILWEKVIDSATEEIDFSSYNSGIYFVHYIYNKRMSVQKLIIQ